MPVYTIPNDRALIDQLKNGFDPLIGNNRPDEGASLTPVIEPVVEEPGPNNVGLPEAIQTNIGIPEVGFTPEDPSRADPAAFANQAAEANAAEQAAQRSAADQAAQAAQNAAAGAAAAAAAGVLLGNDTATATQTIGAIATGTGDNPLATGNQFSITNLTAIASSNLYPYADAPEQGATNLNKRAPMPPLHPHIPSYMAHQDEAQASDMGASLTQFVKRASPAAIHNHIGIFLSAVLGLLVVVGAIWYINASIRKSRVSTGASQEGIVDEEYSEKTEEQIDGVRRWFGLRQAKPLPYAEHIGSFNNVEPAEAGGLRAAMGGNWNSALRNSWETQRTGPPAYSGNGGLADEKNSRGTEVEQGYSRFA